MRIPVQAQGTPRKRMGLAAIDSRGVQPLGWIECGIAVAGAGAACAIPGDVAGCTVASAGASVACAAPVSGLLSGLLAPIHWPHPQ